MFWYVVLAILILAGVTLVESFLIVFNSFCSWLVRDWSFL